jgi:hypothetical protein
MAEAAEHNTLLSSSPPRRYDEAARAALKRHIERADLQRGVSRDVDWAELWVALEATAELHERWAADPKVAARKTLDKLTKCATAINKLRGYLTDPELLSWGAASMAGWSFKAESPERLEHLARGLAELQNELETDARELRNILSGARKTYALDPEVWLVGMVLNIGHRLFPQVGHEDGPLITFLRLALEPVLGGAAPPATTLRSVARRWSASRRNDTG